MYGFELVIVLHSASPPLGCPATGRPTSWDFPTSARRIPLIIAHRGDVTNAPENTLPAFRSAYDRGADGIELDVRLTRDRQLVVFHDRGLKRIGNRRGLVSNATLDEMRALDAGGLVRAGVSRRAGPDTG